jgi:tRNA-binding protein
MEAPVLKPIAPAGSFEELDLRIGRITAVEIAMTRKPTYRLTIDFGPEIGLKVSCGAYRNYPAEELVGRLVVAAMNLGTKQMGPEISEVLTLGVTNTKGETIYLTTESEAPLGAPVF